MILYYYFGEILNCKFRDLECLKSKSVEEILNAQMEVEKKVTSLKLLEFFEPWLPWIDGNLVKGNLLELTKWNLPSDFTFKPFIIGTLTEECVIYIYSGFTKPINSLQYSELILASFKQKAPRILRKYPPNFVLQDQRDILTILATKWVFACSSRRFLENVLSFNKPGSNGYYHYVYDYPLDFQGKIYDLLRGNRYFWRRKGIEKKKILKSFYFIYWFKIKFLISSFYYS